MAAPERAAALRVVEAIARSPAGRPFSTPVTDDVVPGYSAAIRHPMDLGTIASRLSQDAYASLGELWHP